MTESQRAFWAVILLLGVWFIASITRISLDHIFEMRRIERRAELTKLENDRAPAKQKEIRQESDDRLILKLREGSE